MQLTNTCEDICDLFTQSQCLCALQVHGSVSVSASVSESASLSWGQQQLHSAAGVVHIRQAAMVVMVGLGVWGHFIILFFLVGSPSLCSGETETEQDVYVLIPSVVRCVQVHGLQQQLHRVAPWARTSLVYGALPPEARRHQAALFNAPGHTGCV